MPFRSRSDVGIKTRVYLVVATVFLSILVLQAVIFYRWFQESKENALKANIELARAVAKGFETWFQGILQDQSATGIALTSSVNTSEYDRIRMLGKLQALTPGTRSLFWMNTEGQVIASNLQSYVGYDLRERSFFKEIKNGKDWFVSELITVRGTGKIAFTVSRAIRSDDGELLGVIATSVDPEDLDEPLGIVRLSKGGGVGLIDQDGMHVYRFPRTQYSWDERNWLKRYPEINDVLQGKEITGRVLDVAGENWLVVAFVPIPSIGWVASCSQYEDEITRTIIKNLIPQIALILLLTIAVFGVTVGLLRPINLAIARLHRYVVQFSKGEYQQIEIEGPKELKEFGNALDDMAKKVQSRERSLQILNESLEEKVKERTSDLYAANQALEERTHQLRRLAGELTTTEKRERKQLGKILHDGLQQYLVAAKLQLGGIGEHCDLSVRQTVKVVEDLLAESVSVSRSLAAELSPPILHDGGILAGLEWLSRFMANKHGLNVNIVSETDSPKLDEDVKIFLFESVRELLLNIAKHAKTNSAKVSLSKTDGKLLLMVIDHGAGFDPKSISNGYAGFGLFSIRERIGLLGGDIEIVSSPGNGARFCLRVPLNP